MSQKPIVRVINIFKKFGNIVALRKVNLDIKEGEFLTLLGPSGCGKTTLLRIISGFEEQETGEIFIEGKNVRGIPPNRRDTNLLFQNYALFPHLNVFGNISFGLRLKRISFDVIKKEAKNFLKLVNLTGYENRSINQLSGGEMQRVALARALINKPKVLLLDEPLGALDLKLRKELQLEIKNIHKQLGTTFICVTHDQGEALTMSDRIIIMNKGSIIEDGKPIEIYNRPKMIFSASFLGEANILNGKIIKVVNKSEILIELSDKFIAKVDFKEDLILNSSVKLIIRPEKILLRASDKDINEVFSLEMEGIIINSIFVGPVMTYEVKINDNIPKLIVTENYEIGKRLFTISEKVKVFADKKYIIAIKNNGD